MIAERIGPRVGVILLGPLLAAGAGSVLWWHWGEVTGRGDYVRTGSSSSSPCLPFRCSHGCIRRYTHGGYWGLAVLGYALAKDSSWPTPRCWRWAT